MTSSRRNRIGKGPFGLRCKDLDPDSGKELVIKTFRNKALECLIDEATQCVGEQGLVGVCVKTRQPVTRFHRQTA